MAEGGKAPKYPIGLDDSTDSDTASSESSGSSDESLEASQLEYNKRATLPAGYANYDVPRPPSIAGPSKLDPRLTLQEIVCPPSKNCCSITRPLYNSEAFLFSSHPPESEYVDMGMDFEKLNFGSVTVNPEALNRPLTKGKLWFKRSSSGGDGSTKPKTKMGVSQDLKSRVSGLGQRLPSMKKLSGSVMNLLNLRDTQTPKMPDNDSSDEDESFNPQGITFLSSSSVPLYRETYFVFLEGVMGVGKSTLLNKAGAVFGDENIVVFPESLDFWSKVYTDCHQGIYKCLSSKKSRKCCAKVFSHQVKFHCPLKAIARATARHVNGSNTPVTKGVQWCIHDRHQLSASVVFPLMFVRNRYLTEEQFLFLLSMFQPNLGDIIVFVTLDAEDAVKRIRRRGRVNEGKITQAYIEELNRCFRAVYNAWVLLKHLSVSEVLKLLITTCSVGQYCMINNILPGKEQTVQETFNDSLFSDLKSIIRPYRHNAVVLELCHEFCSNLKKIYCVQHDAGEYKNDTCGLWAAIYMNLKRRSSIKPRVADFAGLRALSKQHGAKY